MKSRLLLGIAGLAVAGVTAAVLLLRQDRQLAESAPKVGQIESAAASAPAPAHSPVKTIALPTPATAELRAETLPAEQRAEVDPPMIRGRVVEAESGLARAGIELQLTSRSDTIASVVSDAEGRFELPFSKSNRLAVELVEPEGWKATRRRQRIFNDEPPAKELVFELRLIPGVAFNGRAIDEMSGDLLPYLKLSVGSDLTSTGVQTDGDGHFTSRQRYEAGQVDVAPLTHGGIRWRASERTVDFDGSSRIHDVPLPMGPSYELEIIPPPGYTLDDLRAYLAEVTEECPWVLMEAPNQGAPIHTESGVWVRFIESLTYDADAWSATLWVATADQRWLGSCKVPPRSRRENGRFAIALTPCGSVEVEVHRPDALNDLSVHVHLQRPGRDRCWSRSDPYARGPYSFHLVPPGEY